jgi:hypothetical protein
MTHKFYWQTFEKNTKTSDFMKIRLVGAKLFNGDTRTGGQSDKVKLIVAFRKFANAPKTTSTQQYFVTANFIVWQINTPRNEG